MISTKEAYNLIARFIEKKDERPENAGQRLTQALIKSAIKTLGSILIILKLGGVISWPWPIIFLPLIIIVGLFLITFPVLLLVAKLYPESIEEKLED